MEVLGIFTNSVTGDENTTENVPKWVKIYANILKYGILVILLALVGMFFSEFLRSYTSSSNRHEEYNLQQIPFSPEAREHMTNVNSIRSAVGQVKGYQFDGNYIVGDVNCTTESKYSGSTIFEKECLESNYNVKIDMITDSYDVKSDINIIMFIGNALMTISKSLDQKEKNLIFWTIRQEMKRIHNGTIAFNEIRSPTDTLDFFIKLYISDRTYIMRILNDFNMYPQHKNFMLNLPRVQNTLLMFRSNAMNKGFIVYEDLGIPIEADGQHKYTFAETVILLKDIISGFLDVYRHKKCDSTNYKISARGILNQKTGRIVAGKLANWDTFFEQYNDETNNKCLRTQILYFTTIIGKIWENLPFDFTDKPLKKYVASNGLSALKTRIPYETAIHFYFLVNKLVGDMNVVFPAVAELILEHPLFGNYEKLTDSYLTLVPEGKFLFHDEH